MTRVRCWWWCRLQLVNEVYLVAGLRFWIRQGHQGIFYLVKGTLWGNCEVLLWAFQGHQGNDRGARRQSSLLPPGRIRPVVVVWVVMPQVHMAQLCVFAPLWGCSFWARWISTAWRVEIWEEINPGLLCCSSIPLSWQRLETIKLAFRELLSE